MAPKRKAGVPGGSRPSKRVASGVSTPISLDSDEDYSEGEMSEAMSEAESPSQYEHTVKKFQPDTYQNQRISTSQTQRDAASHLFRANRDWSSEDLKPDHYLRPLWIDPQNGRVVLETFAPTFKAAQNFVINIAEPQSRTTNMHEYTISPHSLFAAVSVGLKEEDIIGQLERYSKTKVPENIKAFVHEVTQSFGKVRLVLRDNSYWIESNEEQVIDSLLRDPVIAACRVDEGGPRTDKAPTARDAIKFGNNATAQTQPPPTRRGEEDNDEEEEDEYEGKQAEKDIEEMLRQEDEEELVEKIHHFEIDGDKIQQVQRRCNVELGMPLTEEYDFRADKVNAQLDIDLRNNVQIRYYQEHALSKMFGNGRARSGIIVLPCGAGKTLVGITAACTIKKSAIVLCTSAMSAVQWKEEFKKWSNIDPDDIAIFTSGEKQKLRDKAGIIICTYSMVTQTTRRAHDSQQVMDFITGREWGLMVLDEVHVVPAEMFRRVTEKIKTHSKLGLTATLLREDDKIKDLNFLIGPKLYEANWLQLSEEGHIARVQCAEVWCPMTTEFYQEYLKHTNVNKRSLLSTMNPRKYQACQFLVEHHERKQAKIIIFSDNVYALEKYAKGMGKPFIYGGTSQTEREQVLQNFQHNPAVRTIFLSKIGDTSLDLPEATVLIQISSHYGSRRQEAQRLGRILRAKNRHEKGFNAFFYSLVSKDTNEMFYSSKRQAFLVDQGYAFKVITNMKGMETMPGLAYSTEQERRDLLQDVCLQSEMAGDVEDIQDDLFSDRSLVKSKKAGVRRQAGGLGELSGARGMAYAETDRRKNANKALLQSKDKFFKKEQKRKERKRKAEQEMLN